jgi:hypothetical protein
MLCISVSFSVFLTEIFVHIFVLGLSCLSSKEVLCYYFQYANMMCNAQANEADAVY